MGFVDGDKVGSFEGSFDGDEVGLGVGLLVVGGGDGGSCGYEIKYQYQ